jgi:Holliday junction resolvase RusA-like endonuclease
MKTITLNLPPPLSVNRTRRIDYRSMPAIKAWKQQADDLYLLQKRGLAGGTITGPFEITITVASSSRSDLDNGVKLLVDTAKDYGVIPDDDPKHLKRLIVQFGEAPEGSRLVITPWKPQAASPLRQAVAAKGKGGRFDRTSNDRR